MRKIKRFIIWVVFLATVAGVCWLYVQRQEGTPVERLKTTLENPAKAGFEDVTVTEVTGPGTFCREQPGADPCATASDALLGYRATTRIGNCQVTIFQTANTSGWKVETIRRLGDANGKGVPGVDQIKDKPSRAVVADHIRTRDPQNKICNPEAPTPATKTGSATPR